MLICTEFRGLKHLPAGNAALEMKNDILYVNNLLQPFDGVSIDTRGSQAWHAALQPLAIEQDTVIGATFQELDSLSRIRTVGQWAFTTSPDGHYAHLVFNSKLEGEVITISAVKRDKKVLENIIVPNKALERGWTIVATYDLESNPSLYLYEVGYRISDHHGSYCVTKSFSCEGLLSFPELRTKNRTPAAQVDRLEVSSVVKAPETKHANTARITQVMLNGQGISSMQIRDELYQ